MLTQGSGQKYTVEGIAYVQAACEREYHSDVFTCSSGLVWIGTGIP